MTDQRYRVRTTSGQQFTWVGNFLALLPDMSVIDPMAAAFLSCLGGAIVQVRHVESMTPLGDPAEATRPDPQGPGETEPGQPSP